MVKHAAKFGTEGGIIGVDISAESPPLAMAKGCCENTVVGISDEPLVLDAKPAHSGPGSVQFGHFVGAQRADMNALILAACGIAVLNALGLVRVLVDVTPMSLAPRARRVAR